MRIRRRSQFVDFEHERQNVKRILKKAEESGAKLYLDGEPATVEKIVENCVNEDMCYMPDYVIGEKGAVAEVRYDKITKR